MKCFGIKIILLFVTGFSFFFFFSVRWLASENEDRILNWVFWVTDTNTKCRQWTFNLILIYQDCAKNWVECTEIQVSVPVHNIDHEWFLITECYTELCLSCRDCCLATRIGWCKLREKNAHTCFKTMPHFSPLFLPTCPSPPLGGTTLSQPAFPQRKLFQHCHSWWIMPFSSLHRVCGQLWCQWWNWWKQQSMWHHR